MKFSLILATINRTEELDFFLRNLLNQTYKKYELIIVDQNSDERLTPIITQYIDKIDIKHIKTDSGLSYARNIGLTYVTGDVVGFPDDDCWYDADLLCKVNGLFDANPDWDGFAGRTVDTIGKSVVGRYDDLPGEINLNNVWNRAVSISIFLKKKLIDKVGSFDENLGVGSKTNWSSGEETDYLIRCILNGGKIYYLPCLKIGHPNPIVKYDRKAITRAGKYSPGMGYVLRKHHYSLLFVLKCLLRPLGGTMISLFMLRFNKSLFHGAVFWGRLKGWLKLS